MSNVKSLWGGPTGVPERNEMAVEVAEAFAEKVRSGEIIGAIVIGLHSDGLASYQLGGRIGGYGLIGAAEVVKAFLVQSASEE
jgi:hypothetical protein